MKKNWKTTLCGAIGALGVYLMTVPEYAVYGKILASAGVFLGGLFAKDGNVTGGTVQQ